MKSLVIMAICVAFSAPFASATSLHCAMQSPATDSPHIRQNITIEMSAANAPSLRLDEYDVSLNSIGQGSYYGEKKVLKVEAPIYIPSFVTETFTVSFVSAKQLQLNLTYPTSILGNNVDDLATFNCN